MAEAVIDKATIVNWAMIDLGLPATFSIDENTERGGVVSRVWPRVVDECFTLHDWSFCRRTSKLARHAESPDNGWTYEFALPGDRIGEPFKVLDQAGNNEHVLRELTIEGDSLFANKPDVWARCRVHRDPKNWDPAFRVGFTMVLGGRLAVPLLQDKSLADEKLKEAWGTPQQNRTGGYFSRLLGENKAAHPVGSGLLDEDPLTSARYM